MNNTVFDIDFTRALPPTLKNDETMLALAKGIAGELQETARLSRLNLIYARIDELEESLLDVLAYDFHVDWYSYDYPIEAKRAVIKDSVKVHKRLGTLYAVKTALGSVYPQSEVEEWFDYNGEPFSFRVVLDVTSAKATAEYFAVKKAVDSYKRMTAHMDDLIYQCRAVVAIRTETAYFFLSSTMTGKHRSGTVPQRNMKGGIAGGAVTVQPQGGGYGFASTQAGTKPQRSTAAALRESEIQAAGAGASFSYRVGAAGSYGAGTEPHRSTVGGAEIVGVGTIAAGRGYGFTSTAAGAEPYRDTGAQTNSGGIAPTITAEGFSFRAKRCGTSRCKNKKGV